MHGITRNTDNSLCSGTKLLLPSWLLGFSTRRERKTQFLLCWLFLHRSSVNPNWTLSPESKSQLTDPTNARASRSPQTGLASSSFKSQLTAFFQKSPKFPAHRFRAWRHSPPSTFPIWGFYYDICDCYVLSTRAWTVLNVCTCTCTKPNSSKPNQTEW